MAENEKLEQTKQPVSDKKSEKKAKPGIFARAGKWLKELGFQIGDYVSVSCEDGKMIIKQGIVHDADGQIRYYVDGVATYAGLVKDTDGSYYYISGNGCIAIRNRTAYITKTNGLLPAGTYTFGADGKMIVD